MLVYFEINLSFKNGQNYVQELAFGILLQQIALFYQLYTPIVFLIPISETH